MKNRKNPKPSLCDARLLLTCETDPPLLRCPPPSNSLCDSTGHRELHASTAPVSASPDLQSPPEYPTLPTEQQQLFPSLRLSQSSHHSPQSTGHQSTTEHQLFTDLRLSHHSHSPQSSSSPSPSLRRSSSKVTYARISNPNFDPNSITQQAACGEMSSFRGLVYSQIEEIGWEHLVRSNDNLSFLSFRVMDKKERVHVLEIQLHDSYPCDPPSISAEVPYICDLKWSASSRLKDVIQQFQKHLEKLQELWDILDSIDKYLWVVGPQRQSHATTIRQINLGNGCSIMLHLDPTNPRSSPECRVIGPDSFVNSLMKMWRRNSKEWSIEKDLTENLKSILNIQVPGPPDAQVNQITECGICYAQSLPTDEGFGAQSGSLTDYTCENTNCSRAFHSICLGDWLQSITTTRRSYDVLFGNCPYCSEPVAVKLSK